MIRPIAVLALVSVLAPVASAQTVYKPGASKYRVEQSVAARQTMQGQVAESNANTLQLLSVELTPAAGGLDFALVVDSASSSMTGAAAAQSAAANEAIRQVVGKKVVGVVSPRGEVTRMASTDSSVAGVQLVASARNFLPRLPDGGIRAGQSWSDSSSADFDNNGVKGKTTVVSKHTVVGDTVISGEPAWHLTQTGNVRMAGAGMSQGADVTLEGTGELRGNAYVTKAGVFLGGDQSMDQKMTIQVPMAGLSIPIEQQVRTRITRTR